MKKQVWFAVVIVVVFLGLVLSGCSASAQVKSAQTDPTLEPVKADVTLMAEGKVVPPKSADLSFASSGVIGNVLVLEGSPVQAGQTLMQLKGNEQLEASIASAELDMLTAQQALEEINDGVDLERAEAAMLVAEAHKELDKAEKKATSKNYQRGGQDQIDAARASYILAQHDFEEAEDMHNRVRDDDNQTIAAAEALTFLSDARKRRDTALANLNYLLLKPNELDVAEIEAQLGLAQAKLEDAQKKLDTLTNGPDSSQVALAAARLKKAQMQLIAAQSSLVDLALTAPFDGTIISVVGEPGTFVQPGTVVAQLADVTNWVVETTDLAERNIGRIKVGMPAVIHVDALPDVELNGIVEHIDLKGENLQGDIVYTVRIKLDQPDPRLLWNMTTAVTFIEE